MCCQYAFNSGLRVWAMLPFCIVWGVDGGVVCKLRCVGRVERVGHALVVVLVWHRHRSSLGHTPWGSWFAGAAVGVPAMSVPRLRSRLRCCTCVASLADACLVLMCPSWEQAVRLLTGLRFLWISATVLPPCTNSTTTAAPEVVMTDKRARRRRSGVQHQG